jgi:hypothetical protein
MNKYRLESIAAHQDHMLKISHPTQPNSRAVFFGGPMASSKHGQVPNKAD